VKRVMGKWRSSIKEKKMRVKGVRNGGTSWKGSYILGNPSKGVTGLGGLNGERERGGEK